MTRPPFPTGGTTGAAARHVRVRLSGLDPATLARVAAALAGIGETGPVSAPYADRRGDGYRLYLDLYLTDDTDANASREG
ncbi:hypothetical protein [Streptodolium elevatio]|uniref:Uncharacterized protein n=1 Tax=Streptodolium elevatio TaxID=3157996 RepID=A0ABV3DFS1_9ACTN